ncbi:hypothetical protein ACFVAV_23320 [Nocardia sp. NPDC057663]|uniref:hypothetical protein n=1 Tax=Nocardia sp. NPDC057663 TaxID=3346201 RepID=UPI00366B003A
MGVENTVTVEIKGYRVTMEWPDGSTQGGPQRLTVEPVDPTASPVGGISSTLLRDINFRDAVESIRQGAGAAHKPNPKRLRAALAEGITDKYLALVAAEYIHAVESGQKHPTKYLGDLLGKSAATVRGHLWQAKDESRGIMTGRPGTAGGVLTDKGRALLES